MSSLLPVKEEGVPKAAPASTKPPDPALVAELQKLELAELVTAFAREEVTLRLLQEMCKVNDPDLRRIVPKLGPYKILMHAFGPQPAPAAAVPEQAEPTPNSQ